MLILIDNRKNKPIFINLKSSNQTNNGQKNNSTKNNEAEKDEEYDEDFLGKLKKYETSLNPRSKIFLIEKKSINNSSKHLNKTNNKTTNLCRNQTSNKTKPKILTKLMHIKMKKNDYLQETNLNNTFFKKYIRCNIKSGFLALVDEFNNATSTIFAFPVYAILNLHTFSLFKNTDPTTSFLGIKLDQIVYITQNYKHTTCFEIWQNNINLEVLEKSYFSVCAESVKEMKEWINSILQFKECRINLNITSPTNGINSNLLVDFHKINILDEIKAIEINKDKSNLFNDARRRQQELEKLRFDNSAIRNETSFVLDLKAQFDLLQDFFQMAQIEKSRAVRKMDVGLDVADKVVRDVIKRKEDIEKVLENEAEKERKKEKDIISKAKAKKEVDYVKLLADKIKKIVQEEIEEFKRNYMERLKEKKQKANREAEIIMKDIQKQNRNMPYTQCVDKRLKNYNDNKYINSICNKFYGENVNFYINNIINLSVRVNL